MVATETRRPGLGGLVGLALAVVVEHPKRDQVHARLAFPGVPIGAPEVPALLVLGRILGGGASSRLFQRLREDEGLTYDVFSGLVLRRPGGLVEVGWACGAEVFDKVWEIVLEELGRLAADVAPDEVEVAVEAMWRGLAMEAEDPAARCAMEASEILERHRDFHLETVLGELRAVDVEAVRALAGRIFHPESMAWAVCGPEAVLERVA